MGSAGRLVARGSPGMPSYTQRSANADPAGGGGAIGGSGRPYGSGARGAVESVGPSSTTGGRSPQQQQFVPQAAPSTQNGRVRLAPAPPYGGIMQFGASKSSGGVAGTLDILARTRSALAGVGSGTGGAARAEATPRPVLATQLPPMPDLSYADVGASAVGHAELQAQLDQMQQHMAAVRERHVGVRPSE